MPEDRSGYDWKNGKVFIHCLKTKSDVGMGIELNLNQTVTSRFDSHLYVI